jgi:hypothetical protein
MTWEWLTDGESEVSERVWVSFEAVQGGTLVRVTHELDESVDTDEPQRQGWDSVLGRLARHAA